MSINNRVAIAVGLLMIGATIPGGGSLAFANDPVADVGRMMGARSNATLRFYDANPSLMVSDLTLIFRPEGQHDTRIELLNAKDGNQVATLAFFPDYQSSNSLFADVRPRGPGSIVSPGAGSYELNVMVAGKIATTFPFSVVEEGGDDPFNPDKKYHYRGPWERLAYLQESDSHTDKPIDVNIWTCALDLDEGAKGALFVKLYRDGEVIARNRRAKSANKRTKLWGRYQLTLHEPVDNPNAPGFGFEKLLANDHDYEIVVEIDGEAVRRFPFTVAEGEIGVSERSALNYEPRSDYLAPRTVDLDLLGQSNFVAREISGSRVPKTEAGVPVHARSGAPAPDVFLTPGDAS